VGNSLDPK
jgi:hypothetical protein